MLYSTGSVHVLGAVLATVTGESLLAQARARIGGPLGDRDPRLDARPAGVLSRRQRDGALAAGHGAVRRALSPGRPRRRGQVLSEGWVESSFVPRTRSPFSGLDYGYGWFLGRARGHAFALARGYGGQIIAVVPDLALTVAITSDPTRPARSEGYFGDLRRLLDEVIVPEAEAA